MIHRAPIFERLVLVVIGAGGTGSALLTHLARIDHAMRKLGGSGFAKGIVFDGDTVSRSNIGRQQFYDCDIGMNKAVVHVTRLNAVFGTNWTAVPKRFSSKYLASLIYRQMADGLLIVSAVDNVCARKRIHRYVKKESRLPVYWLDTGNGVNAGQVVLGSAGKGFPNSDAPILPTVLDLYPDMADDGDDAPSCSLAEALSRQDLLINPTIAAHAAAIVWRLLRHGELEHHGVVVNLATGTTAPIHI